MEGSYCIVTGANSGIGKETARELAAQGAHVVMACRDMGRCATAAAELEQDLEKKSSSGSVVCAPLDVSKPESVRAFVATVAADLKRGKQRVLKVLVNNAGVMGLQPTADCQDPHMSTNHLGPFLLTRLLLPLMAPGSRIVNLASRAHFGARLAIENQFVSDVKMKHWYLQYMRSKLANVLFTAELQRRFGPSGIIATAVAPGIVATNIGASMPFPFTIVPKILPLVATTPAQGAKVAVYAASSPDLNKGAPLFMFECKPREASEAAKDPKLAQQLWEASEQMSCLFDPKCTSYRLTPPPNTSATN